MNYWPSYGEKTENTQKSEHEIPFLLFNSQEYDISFQIR